MRAHVPLRRRDSRQARMRFGAVPRTFARPLLPADATEAEWLAWRGAGRIGASELAALLHMSPHASRFSLWWSKQESWVRPETTMNQHIGRLLEGVIGHLWSEKHPEMLLCRPGAALYGHPEHDWLVCTPDFLAVRDDPQRDPWGGVCIEPVECKSDEGGKGWGTPGTDEVPLHHRVQVYVQCEILGADRGHLTRLAGKRATSYVLPYGDPQRLTMAGWLADGAAFVKSLDGIDPPDVDGHGATTEALQQIYPGFVEGKQVSLPRLMGDEFVRAHDALTRAKQEWEEVRNQIRAALGDAQVGLDSQGGKLVRRNVYKRSGYTVAPTMVDELRRIS